MVNLICFVHASSEWTGSNLWILLLFEGTLLNIMTALRRLILTTFSCSSIIFYSIFILVLLNRIATFNEVSWLWLMGHLLSDWRANSHHSRRRVSFFFVSNRLFARSVNRRSGKACALHFWVVRWWWVSSESILLNWPAATFLSRIELIFSRSHINNLSL